MPKCKQSPAAGDMPPLLLIIPQVAEMLGVRRTKVYRLIQEDGLSTVSLGRRGNMRVAQSSLPRWIEEHETLVGA